jgi:LysM repeat protein
MKKPHLCNPNFVTMQKFLCLAIAVAFSLCIKAQVTELIVKNNEKGLYLEHKVMAKEGLFAIGRLYNVNPKFIAAYNKLDLNKGLEIDQVLTIPLTDTNFTQKNTSGTPVYYEVMGGDGLYKVSNINNKVSLKSLRDWNALTGDNIQEGSKLIVGFLVSKEMVAYLANNRVKALELAKQQQAQQQVQQVPVEEKTIAKAEPVITTVIPPVVAEEKKAIAEEKKKEEVKTLPVVSREEIKPAATVDNGYFKSSFEQQVKAKPISKNSTVTSGIFKTNSGWQDAKYYLLMDGVIPGTIIKIINPDNNKAVYAKVLGEMNGIRQNQGLDIRISNAAASALQVTAEDKFVVKVNY